MKILQSPYFNPILWLVLTLIGMQFFYWSASQALFFLALDYFLEWLFILIWVLTKPNSSQDDKASFVMTSTFFAVFLFFTLFASYWASPFAGKFFDDLSFQVDMLFIESKLILLIMIIGKIISFVAFKRNYKADDNKNTLFGPAWHLKILALLPFIAVIGLIFHGLFILSTITNFLIVGVFITGFEMFWIYYRTKYIK